ncbi:hypothetical protein P692DRAFT_201792728, partial [Suillus brevipes Sb2]
MEKALHPLPCPVVAPLSISFGLRQARGSKRRVNQNENLYNLPMFLSDKLHMPMLSVSTMDTDHMWSSFASAGSRKRRRSRNHSRSMMTNSRTMTRRKMFQLPYLLPGFIMNKL